MKAPSADSRRPRGYSFSRAVPGSSIPAEYVFVPTHDEIYLPIAVRRPQGERPVPVITMGRGDGRQGMPHVEAQLARLAPMQDRMIERGYAVAYVNYRNEIPGLYGEIERAHDVEDTISGGDERTLKSAPTLDSDDLIAAWQYLAGEPWVRAGAIGAIGVSHGGAMILKAAAALGDAGPLACGVVAEGASHEFLSVDTGPLAPRAGHELQYRDVEVARRHADKARAMARIGRIAVPMLHLGRETDHLQGIFRLAHEWMVEAGKDSTWVSFDHPEHGYALIYPKADGRWDPDPIQQLAFDLVIDWFDAKLGRAS